MSKNKIINNSKLITFFTISISIIFISKAFINLLDYGSDFETSYILSKSFWNGIDVFTLKDKNTVYPHIWYILLFPFKNFEYTTVKIIFFFLNLIFLFSSFYILKKKYNLSSIDTNILIILSVTSTPVTNLLGIANLSIFALFFLLVFNFYKSFFLKGLAISFALVKYNVSFLFIIYLFIFKMYKTILVLILINVISILFYFYYLDITNLLKIFEPIKSIFNLVDEQLELGTVGVNSGLFNLHNFFIYLNYDDYYYYSFILLLIPSIYLIKFKIKSSEKIFIFILFLTAFLIYHQLYDFVILIPILAYILKSKSEIRFFKFHLFVIIYIFHLYKINVMFNFPIDKDIYSIIGMFLLITSSYLIVFKKNSQLIK